MQQAMQAAGEIFRAGGWVMLPLLAMSLLAVTLVAERAMFWFRVIGPGSAERYRAVLDAARSGVPPPLNHDPIYGRFLAELRAQRRGDAPPTEADAAIAAQAVTPAVERFGTVLSTIITAAPMLGILGTVTGIIQSFGLLGSTSVVTEPAQLAEGISEALYTTAFGLVIALVTVFPYAAYRKNAERTLGRLELIAAAAQHAVETPGPGGDAAERTPTA